MSNGSVPKGAKPLTHQVAGHVHSDKRPGFLESEDGFILKPLQDPPRGPRELQFYERVFNGTDPAPHVLKLKEFLPKYYGSFEHGEVMYIQLEDVARKFKKPCIADLKMGAITYDPEASEAKKMRELAKYEYLHKLGFQIRGMRIYNSSTEEFDIYDKTYLRSLNEEEVFTKGFAKLFNFGGQTHLLAVEKVLAKLYKIRSWFESQHEFSFYASSLLVAYDADEDAGDKSELVADVRLIDFAHVFPLPGDVLDLNFLSGLRCLISYLERLLN